MAASMVSDKRLTEGVPRLQLVFSPPCRLPRPTQMNLPKIPAGLVTEPPVWSSPVTINANRKGLNNGNDTTSNGNVYTP